MFALRTIQRTLPLLAKTSITGFQITKAFSCGCGNQGMRRILLFNYYNPTGIPTSPNDQKNNEEHCGCGRHHNHEEGHECQCGNHEEGCCGGHGHGEGKEGCCGGHGHGHNHEEGHECQCGNHGEGKEGCCGGHGEGKEGCCGGHGHGEGKEGCCGGHGHNHEEGHECQCGGHGHNHEEGHECQCGGHGHVGQRHGCGCGCGNDSEPTGPILKVMMIPNGELEENCYVIWDSETLKGALVDPGVDAYKVLKGVEQCGCDIEQILCTHGHFDHITATGAIQKAFGDIPMRIHKNDVYMIDTLEDACKKFHITMQRKPQNITPFEDGETVTIGSRQGSIIHTPGHTKGCSCFQFGSFLFSGDTLFCQSIGRTDLPEGDHQSIIDSIQKKLFILDPHTVVLCGHGPLTNIQDELHYNPYVGGKNFKQ
ncbi:hypothetical protein WA158_002749 [Blastocystis sp. Blastoise]